MPIALPGDPPRTSFTRHEQVHILCPYLRKFQQHLQGFMVEGENNSLSGCTSQALIKLLELNSPTILAEFPDLEKVSSSIQNIQPHAYIVIGRL